MIAEFRDRRMRSWKGKLSIDHFHPNDLGYAGMAAIVAEALEKVSKTVPLSCIRGGQRYKLEHRFEV